MSLDLFQSHPRNFEANRYVYPVLSRRAGGISIGVNLNPEKFCNFDCVYCQVQRLAAESRPIAAIDLARLAAELDETIELVVSGRIFAARFQDTPANLRRLNDIALSGDGEPTAVPDFAEAVQLCADARRRHRLDAVKLVLITNASLLHRERVQRGLDVLDVNNGEIWAKLDAGTEPYYLEVARSSVPFRQILDNLRETARVRPIVIQSLFMRLHGEPPAAAELDAYCGRLGEIAMSGGQIKLVQVHTIARAPAESWAAPLANAEVDTIADLVHQRTGLAVAGFYG
jgi:wyosine [tRNA(Phe)-imidazoG37] synthetase (radical SAM superfamily)